MWGVGDSGKGGWEPVKREQGVEELLGKAHHCFLSQISFPAFEEEPSSLEGELLLPVSRYKGVEASEGKLG